MKVAAAPWPRRRYSMEIFRGGGSRRRRGHDVDITPWTSSAEAGCGGGAATTWIVRGSGGAATTWIFCGGGDGRNRRPRRGYSAATAETGSLRDGRFRRRGGDAIASPAKNGAEQTVAPSRPQKTVPPSATWVGIDRSATNRSRVESRSDAAAATWIVIGDESRRRRSSEPDRPRWSDARGCKRHWDVWARLSTPSRPRRGYSVETSRSAAVLSIKAGPEFRQIFDGVFRKLRTMHLEGTMQPGHRPVGDGRDVLERDEDHAARRDAARA